MSRIAGGRDFALAVQTVIAIGDGPQSLRRAHLLNASVDLGDALAFGALLASERTRAPAAVRGIAAALSGVSVGLLGAYLADPSNEPQAG